MNATFSYSNTINQKTYHKSYSNSDISQLNEEKFTFEDLQTMVPFLPEATALLGKAGSTPVLFDLEDPRPGSIIIANDHLPGARKLMTIMMKSLVINSSSSNFQFITISHYPEKWIENIQKFDSQFLYCAGVAGDYEKSTEDWILFLAKKADDRMHGRNTGPAVIVFLDNADLLNQMDVRIRLNFEWLIKYGAQVKIWVISCIEINQNNVNILPLRTFQTKIYGHIDDQLSTKSMDLIPFEIVKNLKPERNFVTKINSNWLRFWAPKLQG